MASKKRSGKKAAPRRTAEKSASAARRKKAKPGRPFSDNPRNYTLSGVRLTEGELDALQTAAYKSGALTFAGWIREALFKAAKYAPES